MKALAIILPGLAFLAFLLIQIGGAITAAESKLSAALEAPAGRSAN